VKCDYASNWHCSKINYAPGGVKGGLMQSGKSKALTGSAGHDGVSGGCQCGAIRYRMSGAFGSASICHCRMCQKAFGSCGAALVAVPFETFKWTRGTPAEFRSSAIVARGFCKDCGTPLYLREDGDTNIEMAICTLDNPNAVTLTHQSGIESQVDWFAGMAQLPGQKTTDYRTAKDMQKLASLQHPDYDTDDDWFKSRT
jgi:hypothetical protein